MTPVRSAQVGPASRSDIGLDVEIKQFDRVVEPYRHGITRGSNYLKFDGHVDTNLPNEALIGMDPWDLRVDPPTPPNAPASALPRCAPTRTPRSWPAE